MEQLRGALAGVAVTSVTPFDHRGRVDGGQARKHAAWLAEQGIRLIIPSGNTGEFHSLTREGWRENLAATIAGSQGRAHVVPAVGGAIDDALEMAQEARDAGAAGVMVLPLHHTFTSADGVEEYLLTLLRSVDLPVVAYVRQAGHLEATMKVVHHPRLVGMKFAVPDVALFANTVANSQEDVVWSCGIAEQWAPFFGLAGAVGFTSGIGNFCPRLPLALYDAIANNDWTRALRLRNAAVPFELIRARRASANNVPAVKAAMDTCGLSGGRVLPPISDLPAHEAEELVLALQLIQEAVGEPEAALA